MEVGVRPKTVLIKENIVKEQQVYFLVDLCNRYNCLSALKAGFNDRYSRFEKMFVPTTMYVETGGCGPVSINTDLEAIMIDTVVETVHGKYGRVERVDNTESIMNELTAAQIPYMQYEDFILIKFDCTG